MRASLLHAGDQQGVLVKAKETLADALGIKDEAASMLFMIFGQVDLGCIFGRCLSMINTVLLVGV